MARIDAYQKLRWWLAGLMRRQPWLYDVLRSLYRLLVVRFTVGVVGVVLNDQGQVLLVEHVLHPRAPWGLPGGWLERGERPVDALQREIQEETGLVVRVASLLLIDKWKSDQHLDIAYLCRAEDDITCLSGELLGYRWAQMDTISSLSPFHQEAVEAARAMCDEVGEVLV